MKKNKLFTAVAAIALLGSTGVGLVANNAPVAQAATKKSKKSKSTVSSKYPVITIKKGAVLYKVTVNKTSGKITKVTNSKRIFVSATKVNAIYSTKYKKTNYYLIDSGYAVKTSYAKVTGKKKVPTLTSLTKAAKAKAAAAQKKVKDTIDQWNSKITAAAPQTYTGKVNTAANYLTYNDSTKKWSVASDTLASGTPVTVLFTIDLTSSNGSTIPGYYAVTSNNTAVLLEQTDVTLDDANAQVLDQSTYTSKYNAAKQLQTQALAALKAIGAVPASSSSNN